LGLLASSIISLSILEFQQRPYYILIVLGLSGVMTFLFNLSGQSLIVAILVHAMFNTASRWLAALLGDQTLRDRWSPELVMGLCGVIIASILMVVTRGNLAYLEPKMKAQDRVRCSLGS